MKLKIIVTALVLSLALPAAAQFKTIAAAYEIALSDIRLPQRNAGTIAYRKCAECSYETKRVDESTVWEINGKSMSLDDFRKALRDVADPDDETIQVLHHLESDRVTKVWILLR
ncbi:MAG TPA: hypothetical protein VLA06_00055 [Woeseiaceae bacterium]|jgi:hypothetical protein|nr:hypothetical protein [Woeseiaceae bacterium]